MLQTDVLIIGTGIAGATAALKFNRYEIDVPEDIRVRAARSVQRMIEIG